jgi:hypothetical protein
MSVSLLDAIVRFDETGYIAESHTYFLQLHDELGCIGSTEG